jgi:hypothetical protein
MDGEGLISWNLPNVFTFILMLAIIWVAAGAVGHVFVRQPGKRNIVSTATSTVMDSAAVV